MKELCISHMCYKLLLHMILRHIRKCRGSKVVSKWDKIFHKICSFPVVKISDVANWLCHYMVW